MDKNEFIERVANVAVKHYKEYKILPSLVIAQAILESSWGKKAIENNIFGIKAGSSWKGRTVLRNTREWNGREYVVEESRFRAYDSIEDSIMDYLNLVGNSRRYEKVKNAKDYKEAARLIYEAGYATDPEYADKLIDIIEKNSLYQYDLLDEPISLWAADAWSWGIENGITDGTNPKGCISREQCITMLYRLYKLICKPQGLSS
ncbi:MAG TPA: glycoside hydrolase family 73 protein [Tissierellia bacterium]|nr:glycoside hydrolase family 73 protein [Tissierellia bacterium]